MLFNYDDLVLENDETTVLLPPIGHCGAIQIWPLLDVFACGASLFFIQVNMQ